MNVLKKKRNIKPEIVIIVLAALFHIFISNLLGIWYEPAPHDDGLLINYANLAEHFHNPNIWTLVKTMSYPLFLAFVHITGLSYSMIVSFVWIITALLAMHACKFLSKNRIFLVSVYLFVLFSPAAFDLHIGTKLYRNSIIVPFVMILFSLFFILLFKIIEDKNLKVRKIVGIGFVIGFIFTFTYYIKEDGIWLLACLLFIILMLTIITIVRYIKTPKKEKSTKRLVQMIIAFLVPLFLFIGGTNIYKMVNYHYFGVYEVETRNSGEMGDFVKRVYEIASDDRTSIVWAPADAIEKAFAASKTLSDHPELFEAIVTTDWWGGDIYKSPIVGDFLTWVLHDELESVGLYQSEKQVDDFFKQVNAELDEAFENGTLEKDTRIQLLSSAGGMTFDEILGLGDDIIAQYNINIFLESYEPGGTPYSDRLNDWTAWTSVLTNTNLYPTTGTTTTLQAQGEELGNQITKYLFMIYSILNPLLCVLAVVGTIATAFIQLRKLFKTKHLADCKSFTIASSVIIMAGITLVYAFGISWFCDFIWVGGPIDLYRMKYYSVGMIPLLSFIEIFGAFLFFRWIGSVINYGKKIEYKYRAN